MLRVQVAAQAVVAAHVLVATAAVTILAKARVVASMVFTAKASIIRATAAAHHAVDVVEVAQEVDATVAVQAAAAPARPQLQ